MEKSAIGSHATLRARGEWWRGAREQPRYTAEPGRSGAGVREGSKAYSVSREEWWRGLRRACHTHSEQVGVYETRWAAKPTQSREECRIPW